VAGGSFVTVARLEDVPQGTVRAVRAGEEEIAVVHCEAGIFATQAHCIHLQGPLAEGRLHGCLLTCPWHGWQYDVRSGENTFDLAIKLETYEVEVADGEIRVRA
jgi:nitrite reductase (NADH) small subunit